MTSEGLITHAWVEPGTGPGVGEVQVFAAQKPDGELSVRGRVLVVGYECERRAVTRSVDRDGRWLSNDTLEVTLADLNDGGVLVTHRMVRTEVPARRAREHEKAMEEELLHLAYGLVVLLGAGTTLWSPPY